MKKSKVLASKFRHVKTFKGEKYCFIGQKVIAQPPSVTDGAIYDKHPTLTTSVWYLSARNFLCLFCIVFHSQKAIVKCYK